MSEQLPDSAQVATLLGIVNQLYATRMNTLLQPEGFTLSQFALLNHLVGSEKPVHSITDLTEAMEINQPGVTKIVQKLRKEGLVEVEKNKHDSRKREVCITAHGREKVLQVAKNLFPDVDSWFRDWEVKDTEQFTRHLRRLALWLDENRLKPQH